MSIRDSSEFPLSIRLIVPVVVCVVITASTVSITLRGIRTFPSVRDWLKTEGIRLWVGAIVFMGLAFICAF